MIRPCVLHLAKRAAGHLSSMLIRLDGGVVSSRENDLNPFDKLFHLEDDLENTSQ